MRFRRVETSPSAGRRRRSRCTQIYGQVAEAARECEYAAADLPPIQVRMRERSVVFGAGFDRRCAARCSFECCGANGDRGGRAGAVIFAAAVAVADRLQPHRAPQGTFADRGSTAVDRSCDAQRRAVLCRCHMPRLAVHSASGSTALHSALPRDYKPIEHHCNRTCCTRSDRQWQHMQQRRETPVDGAASRLGSEAEIQSSIEPSQPCTIEWR